MIVTLELTLVLLVVLGLGVWGVVTGIAQSRRQPRQVVTAQQLSSLAQPFRSLLGEAVAVQKDVASQAQHAPKNLKRELERLSLRVERLVLRALPRARHGTNLSTYLLELSPTETQYTQTQASITQVTHELEAFVQSLRTLQGKVYQVLTDAASLEKDSYLAKDLDDALIEISALEEAFASTKQELEW